VDVLDFDYSLPPELIAQKPAVSRDASRLLSVCRQTGTLRHHRFADLPGLLRAGDVLIVNDSRVIAARVLARDAADREVELLFVEPVDDGSWRALVRPGKRCPPGAELTVSGAGAPRLRVRSREPDGTRTIEALDGDIAALLDAHGLPPLPPYIEHHATPGPEDRERYQTVYARSPGSVAAPTAGLHFSDETLGALRARGITVEPLTLHVGPATFRPLRGSRVEDHELPPERVVVPERTAAVVNAARAEGRRIIAVGTTTTRALEAVARDDGTLGPFDGRVALFIYPGHRFRIVGALLTNFHLPRSSLLVLVSAFAGRDLVLRAYREAIAERYRFYSYGDASLFL
jgi:S-adenosylmethionine:tRNA ribosyltransferase-isomerase